VKVGSALSLPSRLKDASGLRAIPYDQLVPYMYEIIAVHQIENKVDLPPAVYITCLTPTRKSKYRWYSVSALLLPSSLELTEIVLFNPVNLGATKCPRSG
jgi:hypothetical protein